MNARSKNKLIAAYIVVLLALSACAGSTTQANPGPSNTKQPTVEAASATPTSTPTATASPTPPLAILYQDDFYDPASGWESYHQNDGMLDYDNGKYRMQIPLKKVTFWVSANVDYENVVIEADAIRNGGPLANLYGLLCRLDYATNAGYMFLISSQGYYGIAKYVNPELDWLGNDDLVFSDAVFTDDNPNHLHAECNGTHLAFSVNGQMLLEVNDDSFTKGDVGFAAGTTGEPGTDVSFDNLVIYAP
jgi:hypothetical protein